MSVTLLIYTHIYTLCVQLFVCTQTVLIGGCVVCVGVVLLGEGGG